jgi:hypothetical protein
MPVCQNLMPTKKKLSSYWTNITFLYRECIDLGLFDGIFCSSECTKFDARQTKRYEDRIDLTERPTGAMQLPLWSPRYGSRKCSWGKGEKWWVWSLINPLLMIPCLQKCVIQSVMKIELIYRTVDRCYAVAPLKSKVRLQKMFMRKGGDYPSKWYHVYKNTTDKLIIQ